MANDSVHFVSLESHVCMCVFSAPCFCIVCVLGVPCFYVSCVLTAPRVSEYCVSLESHCHSVSLLCVCISSVSVYIYPYSFTFLIIMCPSCPMFLFILPSTPSLFCESVTLVSQVSVHFVPLVSHVGGGN